ncbi:MAG TPA: IPTL-CTERM sorting domain-containing protein, partial [Thermoanaerobaculia bacterium]|nr:IPTL-CTERM sorting domain-containing protein [Thermoanaerobaculia bacterium]
DGDGNPEPGTGDALVATTVTDDDVYGQPGYYLFDGLIPGLRYFVQFVLPASATGFTSQNSGGDDTIDSDADTTNGTTQTVILAPGEVNRTVDAGLVTATGTLALGDQVWMESDNDGVFEPQNGEMGVDGVRLNLYLDANGDGLPTLDEYIATTTTFTQSGFAGRYRFDNLAPGTYIVVVAPQSFGGGGALSGKVTATGNDPAPDPDDDANGDDNGTDVGALTASLPVTLTDNGEPTAEDGNNDTNLTVDFGFIPSTPGAVPEYDYGDAPDVIVGTAPGDYNTTALDNGAYHQVGVPNAPYLGACVDADGGFNQDVAASQDDTGGFGAVVGTCASGGDDEDGVSFTGPFAPGATASFTVTAGSATACTLSAWVDWNRNGVFGDAGEQIAADVAVSGAPTVLSPAVPAGAVPGLTYARFRCASAGGLSPTGPAADGEVEDYLVGILGTDFGDAPASYGTDGAGAASHAIDPLTTLFLGACVDTEADGQPNAAANGDDVTAGTSRVGNCFDDEDGVAFGGALLACQTGSVTITASAAGELDGFLDWSADGDFDDAGEQIFTGQSLAAGANPLTFPIPCTAVTGGTYARFRLSSSGSPGPTGAAADGEVEDYLVNVGPVDFGDAPDTYGTLLGSNGPNHGLVTGFSLGATVDGESQGQPSVGATGDGADEDGVVLPNSSMITACATVQVSVFLTNTAGIATPRLDAWIDFDGDGAFGDPRDRIATGLALTAGANAVNVNVPCDAQSAATYARFRLSSAGVSGPGGASPDGEVEDYALIGKGLDFGDAPDPTYPTLLASNGARHVVLPTGNPALGPTVDTEPNGQPGATLLGDDGTGSDDEDGVTFPAVLIPGTDGTIQLTTGTTGGTVSCWIDFEQDGDWSGAGEQVVTDAAIAASTVTSRTFPVPVGAPQGTAATRCRISSQTGLGVTGEAPDGEIEDHPAPVGVEAPALGVAKRLVSAVRDANLAQVVHVTFEIRVENAGNVPLSNLQVTENLAATFVGVPSFTVTSVQSATFAVNPGFNGTGDTNLLAAGNSLAVGMSGTITVAVRVDSGGNRGPFYNQVTGSGTSPGTRTVTDDSQDGSDPDPDGNDDPSDNGDPTVVILPISPHEIPTLGEWGLLAMAALLGLFALRRLRRPARA